jgi:hypothetical protein
MLADSIGGAAKRQAWKYGLRSLPARHGFVTLPRQADDIDALNPVG